MFDKIQRIGPIIGSNNLIINGDVVANSDILTTIATQLLRQDLVRMSQEAREEMQACANECVQKVLEQVVEQTNKSEYVLAGTLLSIFIAVLVGLGVMFFHGI